MSSNKDIEKLFSSTFDDYQHELDQEAAWQHIEEKLDNKKKRRFLFWLWPAGVLVVGLIMVFLIPISQDPANQIAQQDQDEIKTSAESPNKTTNRDETPTQNLNNEFILNTVNANNSRSTSQTNLNTPNSKKELNKTTASATTADVRKNPKPIAKEEKQLTRQSTRRGGKTLSINSEIYPSSEQENEDLLVISTNHQRGNQPIISADAYENTQDAVVSDVRQKRVRDQFIINKIGLLPLTLFPITEAGLMVHCAPPKETNLVLKPSKKNNFFIDVSASGLQHFISTKTRAANEPRSNQYLNSWNESQSKIGGYGFDIMIGKAFGRHLELAFGIQYQRIFNKIERSEPARVERRVVWDDRAQFTTDQNGNQVFIGGNVIQTEIYTKGIRAKQIHSVLSVPVKLGWSTYFGQTKFGLHGGPILNISQSFRGKVLNENDEIVEVNKNKISSGQNLGDQIYRSNIGLSWSGALRISRGLGKKLEVYSQLEFQYNPNDWMTESNLLKAKQNALALNIGLRRNF